MMSKNEILKYIEAYYIMALNGDEKRYDRVKGFMENMKSKSDTEIYTIFRNITGIPYNEISKR